MNTRTMRARSDEESQRQPSRRNRGELVSSAMTVSWLLSRARARFLASWFIRVHVSRVLADCFPVRS